MNYWKNTRTGEVSEVYNEDAFFENFPRKDHEPATYEEFRAYDKQERTKTAIEDSIKTLEENGYKVTKGQTPIWGFFVDLNPLPDNGPGFIVFNDEKTARLEHQSAVEDQVCPSDMCRFKSGVAHIGAASILRGAVSRDNLTPEPEWWDNLVRGKD